MNARCRYPIGHPVIVTENFDNLSSYLGLVKCKVTPPRGHHLPVLPLRSNGKLTFPLCKPCTDQMIQTPCEHTPEERSWVGTFTTIELEKAVQTGYVGEKIYEVWHYPDSKVGLFVSYIRRFLKLKQVASGYPEDCHTEEEKTAYVEECHCHDDIRLYPERIGKSGIRSVAKLALNSLWGKFGQRTEMSKTEFVGSYESLMSLIYNDNVSITGIIPVSDDVLRVVYTVDEDSRKRMVTTNEVIAAFTTAHARLKLYSVMEEIDASGSGRLLYTDTDSVFYIKRAGEVDPECGRFLGDLTDEYPGRRITSFVTGGPKVYSYTFEDGGAVTKVKGITLNSKNAKAITPEALTKMVVTPDGSTITVTNNMKITRTPADCIVSRREEKTFRVVYTKRVVASDSFETHPYGF